MRRLLFLVCLLLTGCQSCLEDSDDTSSSTSPAPTETTSSRNAVVPQGIHSPFNPRIISRDGGD